MGILQNDLSLMDQYCYGPATEHRNQIRKRFYERALCLCGHLAEFYVKFGVSKRQNIAQISVRLNTEMDTLFVNKWVPLNYRHDFYKIKYVAHSVKCMKVEVAQAFMGNGLILAFY